MNGELCKIAEGRLARAKWAYSTRRVDQTRAQTLVAGEVTPQAGDLVLAKVTRLGQHKRLELVTSRRATMFEGDEIVVAFGNRYAPDQFEGIVPDRLEACRLVAAGGVAARTLNRHARMKSATRITPVGLLGDQDGKTINLADFRLPNRPYKGKKPLFLAVAGTSMNAGKTSACSNLVKGLVRRNLNVAAAKLTGTGAGADYRALVDAGANPVLDFVDAGLVSTYRINNSQLLDVVQCLCSELSSSGADVVVLEVADGILQKETAQIFTMPEFTGLLDGVMFAANDSLGAQAGVKWLEEQGLPVIGVTGVLTSSPLAIREAENSINVPVYITDHLRRSVTAAMITACMRSRRKHGNLPEDTIPLIGIPVNAPPG